MSMVRFSLLVLLALLMGVPAVAAPTDASTVGVRGFWSIVVKNPDGTLASKTEFENAYVPTATLSLLLARQRFMRGMEVRLRGDSCRDDQATPASCRLHEPDSNEPAAPHRSLNLSATENGSNLILQGSVIANPNDQGTVNAVEVRVNMCEGAGACGTRSDAALTFHEFANPIPVQEGQQIQVTVNISFVPQP
jgi:hypothetical protein